MEKVIWFITGSVVSATITCLIARGYMQRLKKQFEELLAVKNSTMAQQSPVVAKEKKPIDLGGLSSYEKTYDSLDDLVAAFRAHGLSVYVKKPEHVLYRDGRFWDEMLCLHAVATETEEDLITLFYGLYQKTLFDTTEKEKALSSRTWEEVEFEEAYLKKFIEWYIKDSDDNDRDIFFCGNFHVYEGTEITTTQFSSSYFKAVEFDESRRKEECLRISVRIHFHFCPNFETKLKDYYGTEEYPQSVMAK